VFAIGLGLVVALVAGDDDGDDTAGGPTSSATTAAPDETDPSTTTEPTDPETPDDAVSMTPTGDDELDAVIEESARFVEDHRGLAFKEPVLVEALDDDAFVERLRAEVDSDEEYLEYLTRLGDLLIALGVFDEDTDVVDAYLSALDAGVLATTTPRPRSSSCAAASPTSTCRASSCTSSSTRWTTSGTTSIVRRSTSSTRRPSASRPSWRAAPGSPRMRGPIS
jgi:hypothetical protein